MLKVPKVDLECQLSIKIRQFGPYHVTYTLGNNTFDIYNMFSDNVMKAVQRKKKKPLAERIAEKEAARAEAEKKEVKLILF